MSGWDQWAVSLAVFLPTVGAIAVCLTRPAAERAAKTLAMVFSGAALAVGILMLFGFHSGTGLQFAVDLRWIPAIGARYHVGVDGISLPLLELTLLLSFLCAVYSYRILPSPGRARGFLALMLLLETGMAGTFVAFDLVLFFVFWEMVLVPMYFMIGIWGSGNRQYAAVKFFLYTFLGSVFMLLGFIAMYFAATPHTFDILALQVDAAIAPFSHTMQMLAFAAVFLGFAVKVPMWPFHTWLPDAHTEAPTVGSVLLAGVLLKMGGYGFIRIAFPILPDAAHTWAPWIAVLAVIAIVYASLACLAQRDLKRLIAFSSVGHMGFVMLGIATLSSVGINAAIFGMVAHGLITGMLFFEIGSIYDRYHTRQIADLGGGMLLKVPYLGFVFAFTAIASMGLPGLAGFWGEVLSLFSAYQPPGLNVGLYRTLMVFGGIGTVLTAGYILWTIQRVAMGKLSEERRMESIIDVSTIEWVAWAPLLAGIVVLGLVPKLITGATNDAVNALVRVFHPMNNPPIDFHAILPELILAVTLLVVLFVDLFLPRDRKWWAMPISFAGMTATLIATLTLIGTTRVTFGGSYVVDDFAVLFKLLFESVALVILLLCWRYLRDGRYFQGEFYFLLLCSFLGCITMSSSRDLLLLFISLEMVSAPGFLLAGLRKGDPRSNEAALKFFLISVLSTAIMLYGMSLIYGITGTTRLTGIAEKLAGPAGDSNLALAAILFVVAGFAFKVSAFPFQFWAPDTYEGAPVPVAAYLSVASKAAGFVGLLQLMFHAFLPEAHFWAPIFGILCVFTMFMGNLVALQQRQVVRLFAYSSIAQAGYMLLPFALAGYSASVDKDAFASVVLYIMIYAVTNLGAFSIVVGMSGDAPTLLVSDFAGLGQRAAPAAIAMATCLVSLAGIPPTAGFWGKFFIFVAAIHRGDVGVWLAAAMVINSVISLVYYLAIVRSMWLDPIAEPVRPLRIPPSVGFVAAAATIGILAVGIYPQLFARFPPFTAVLGP